MGATEDLARFACELKFEQVPGEALVWAKDAILDCIGVALAGTQEDAGKLISDYVKEAAGRPEAGVFATGLKISAGNAALANGTMAHALDYDDYVLPNWTGHPTAPLLPGILALGQRQGISGKEVLLAYIVGFEVGGRVGAGLGRGHYELGWHATATLGTLGATAACCSILKLDVAKTRAAMGIASSEAGGVRQNFGTMTKPLHAGLASRNGLVAALMAARGFTADPGVIEGPFGFGRVFTGGGNLDWARMGKDLGKSFLIVENGVSIKPYPCCAEGHRCLDAILFLIRQHDIKADQVESVECRTGDMVPQVMIRHRPKTAAEAKFSMEYCMAVALLDRSAGLPQFTSERVAESKVQELLTRVHYVHPPQASGYLNMERTPEQVTVKMRDGAAYSHEILESKGKPGNPLSEAELIAKFKDCASRALSRERIERSLDMLRGLEKIGDIGELMEVLCAWGVSGRR
jgi:2-methylcitrate dehydratase PrpD